MRIAKRAATVALAAVGMLLAAHLYLLDGLGGVVWPLVFETDTEYASGYSEAAFRRVQPSMSRQAVISLLGRPLATARDWFATWR